MNRIRYDTLVATLLLCASLVGCDAVNVAGDDPAPPEASERLEPSGAVTLAVNDLHVTVDSTGEVRDVRWHSEPGGAVAPLSTLRSGGLWLAATQGAGVRATGGRPRHPSRVRLRWA